jgi:large subunit ribosomal protein L21
LSQLFVTSLFAIVEKVIGNIFSDLKRILSMYAVIKTGGKQYKVAVGDVIKVEKISAEIGKDFQLNHILAVKTEEQLVLGNPFVSGAFVTAKIISHGRREKVHIFKMRRRKHYQKRQGHRQSFTEIQIDAVKS